jgi:hypothetical protein
VPLIERDHAREPREAVDELRVARDVDELLDVRRDRRHDHEIQPTVADRLPGDAQVAGTRVVRHARRDYQPAVG